ncbi:DUF4265 domain-containing protein [Pedobacter nutrimenti]|uniref:Uncharacterized protein DUF4265 n=1 Tax=Pedobacter nutrimenti TaxID=1241337 RepID=A0A318UFG3_9SPHI|nr:DUF4265 domain-containing protein [Pedobacter nutrimenti]PYF74087.1 uncharacterized protein DUF4265 [Pedobacter nutrimenti]
MPKEEHIKILFQFYSDVLEQHTVETMWAITVDQDKGLYKLDSIPFYAPDIAANDVFFAEFDEEQERLTYRYIVEYSGNSTVQVVMFNDETPANDIREEFDILGCSSEKANEAYFVIDVPVDVDYAIVRRKLMELEESGIIGYAEPCLSDKHRMD